jgi:hypothetical protein
MHSNARNEKNARDFIMILDFNREPPGITDLQSERDRSVYCNSGLFSPDNRLHDMKSNGSLYLF